MSIKKLPYYLLVALLTLGASAILGFLSFTGMLALSPLLGLAIAAFVLSVVYEAEIYSQNIRSALHKIFRMDYLRQVVGMDLLKAHFPWEDEKLADDAPELFKDYCDVTKTKDKNSKALRKKLLKDMEKTFIRHLENPEDRNNEPSLQQWILNKNLHKIFEETLRKKRVMYALGGIFSVTTTVFMSVGTSYLLMESIGSVSLFAFLSAASLPAIIIPLSILAGIAYGMLAFNSITDMINNNTLVRWARKVKGYWLNDEGKFHLSAKGVVFSIAALALAALAVTLTVLTAGTWWTVVQKTKPVISWLATLPEYVMGIINPIIVGVAQLSFNLSNTAETLDLIESASKKSLGFRDFIQAIFAELRTTYEREGLGAFLNPFRVLYKLIYTPVRLLLFLGHLISIGVTSDRVPEMDEVLAAILGIISETFEDAHYFFGHEHQHAHKLKDKVDTRLEHAHGHNHGLDIPAKLLRLLLLPLMLLAKVWTKIFVKEEQIAAAPIVPDVSAHEIRDANELPITRVKKLLASKLAKNALPENFEDELNESNTMQEVQAILSEHRVSELSVFRKIEKYFPKTEPAHAVRPGGL